MSAGRITVEEITDLVLERGRLVVEVERLRAEVSRLERVLVSSGERICPKCGLRSDHPEHTQEDPDYGF